MSVEENILHAVANTEHCQRNWDHSQDLNNSHLTLLINVATTMPTKQNQEYYQLIVSTDIDFNKEIYKLAYYTEDENPSYKNQYNYQVASHALFLWCPFINFKNNFGDYQNIGRVSIGVSAGAVALSANQLGYRTGFCACFDQKRLVKKLNFKLNLQKQDKIQNVEVGLGIGIPDLRFRSNEVVEDNKIIKVKPRRTKNIKIYQI
jgi:nitroreductase